MSLAVLSPELEHSLRRIQNVSEVIGYVVVNRDGIPVKSSLDTTLTSQYTALIVALSKTAMSVIRGLDPTNELEYLRVKGKKEEILVAPDEDYVLFVIQNLHQNEKEY